MERKDRDRIARWMGWWDDTRYWNNADDEPVCDNRDWLNPPTGDHMLMLLERLREDSRRVEIHQFVGITICSVYKQEERRLDVEARAIKTEESVALAVLAMLEASEYRE